MSDPIYIVGFNPEGLGIKSYDNYQKLASGSVVIEHCGKDYFFRVGHYFYTEEEALSYSKTLKTEHLLFLKDEIVKVELLSIQKPFDAVKDISVRKQAILEVVSNSLFYEEDYGTSTSFLIFIEQHSICESAATFLFSLEHTEAVKILSYGEYGEEVQHIVLKAIADNCKYILFYTE